MDCTTKKKLIFALQVMCIKSGFYLIQRSSKSRKQLQSYLDAYITLGCQHSLMYCSSKKTFVRSTFTKLCTNPVERCRFTINIALCKITNRWYTSNKGHKKTEPTHSQWSHQITARTHILFDFNVI
mgnify:CR=1 FL=1